MLRIGLTGGIGSGKSTVSKYFQELYNIMVIDADKISRDLLSPHGAAYNKVIHLFGDKSVLPSGKINRQFIREQIFSQQNLRDELEKIIHPKVKSSIIELTESLDAAYCIIMIPLLIESNMQSLVDRILVVQTNPTLQISRVAKRDQCPESQVKHILEAQLSPKERQQHADDIIMNNEAIEDLIPKIEQLHQKYLALGA